MGIPEQKLCSPECRWCLFGASVIRTCISLHFKNEKNPTILSASFNVMHETEINRSIDVQKSLDVSCLNSQRDQS